MCTLKVLMSLESCWTLVAGNVAVRMRRFVYNERRCRSRLNMNLSGDKFWRIFSYARTHTSLSPTTDLASDQ